jgi:hypothetical protein
VVALDRGFHEVFALDPELAAEGHLALAELGVERVVGGVAALGLAGG